MLHSSRRPERTVFGQDMYCLGIALYQLATGDDGLTNVGERDGKAKWQFVVPSGWQTRPPAGWSTAGWWCALPIIQGCLSSIPHQRPPAHELLEWFGPHF